MVVTFLPRTAISIIALVLTGVFIALVALELLEVVNYYEFPQYPALVFVSGSLGLIFSAWAFFKKEHSILNVLSGLIIICYALYSTYIDYVIPVSTML